MYKLSTKSNSAKFFSWIWRKDVSDYNTMCPYFWNYVLTILFIIPILAIKFIAMGLNKTVQEKKLTQARNYVANSKVGDATEHVADFIFDKPKFWGFIGSVVKWVFIVSSCIIALGLVIFLISTFILYPINSLAVVGALALIAAGIFLIVDLEESYDIGRKLGYPFRLFGNMVSSLYNNWCPLIKWD